MFRGSWFFFFKQKTAYEMRISDWSSDVCSSDLTEAMLMGLRLTEGVDLARIEARSGLPREAFVDAGAVARLAGQGLMRQDGDRLAVTEDGILLLDSIISDRKSTRLNYCH